VSDRYSNISTVLWRVLLVNLVVALAKIALGYYSGAVSIISDGFHSLTDTAGNVVGLIGVSIARRPPDANHPYGHRKYETMASVGIMVFLILVLVEVGRAAITRLLSGAFVQPFSERTAIEGIGLMVATLIVNLTVVAYESRNGRRLKSEVLLADATHTRSDVLTSSAVLVALVGVWYGYPIFDPVAALLVAGFIGHACWSIAQEASRILGDETMMDEGEVRQVVQSVPTVLGSEKIRTRGSADYVFLDLHLWLDRNTPLHQAHETSHVVKDKLMAKFPQLMDVVIHIEPPPNQGS
jgi:cation diffusion facilitator family transporter